MCVSEEKNCQEVVFLPNFWGLEVGEIIVLQILFIGDHVHVTISVQGEAE